MAEANITLDTTKPYGECRGDRTPDDPHYRVAFWQGGRMNFNGKVIHVNLPFDVNGKLVEDDGKADLIDGFIDGKPIKYHPLYSAEMRAYLAAKKERAANTAATPQQTLIEDEGKTDDILDQDDDVNLVAWLKGDAKYQPHVLRAAAKKRYHKTYSNIGQLVVDLVYDEEIVTEAEVCPALSKYLKSLKTTAEASV